jgi:hypothetical protein
LNIADIALGLLGELGKKGAVHIAILVDRRIAVKGKILLFQFFSEAEDTSEID